MRIKCIGRLEGFGILIKITIISVLIILTILFLYNENNNIGITNYEIKSSKIPDIFSGTKIVHLSDLHNKSFGKNNIKLLEKVKKSNPDFIVITGDIIDRRIYKESIAIRFLNELTKISDVYYVTGNHEWGSGKYYSLKRKIAKTGTKILDNRYFEIKKGNESILILGVDDSLKYSNIPRDYKRFKDNFNSLVKDIPRNKYNILLSHRPEFIEYYSNYDIDIVFSGHVHGGQVRIPFIGGLLAPSQGLFPKYSGGVYEVNNTNLVLSRGLGNSSIAPQRIFNRPEVVVVILKSK